MRGALFNMLGDIEGLTVLDAFAGSGALGYEAISRGASHVVAIDADKTAQKAITSNSKQLGLEGNVKLIKASANAWLSTNPDASFDIVLLDPPYNDLQKNLLTRLAGCVKPGGLAVLSWPGSEEPPVLDGLEQIENRSYGDGQLIFYRR